MITMVAVMACLAVIVPLMIFILRLVRGPQAWPAASSFDRRLLVLLSLVLALLWLRPHEDTFTGLDVAAYRLMTHALINGREWHEQDAMLAKIPPALWNAFTYEPGAWGRPTRDRVFKMESDTSAKTQPFFLPSLPLAAQGWSRMVPGADPDSFVPFIGLVFGVLLLITGFSAGRGWGLAIAGALLMGSIYPIWFLRGYFTEAVGTVMITAVLLAWLASPMSRPLVLLAGLVLGFSVSFHPTLIVLALPLSGLIAVSGENIRQRLFIVLTGLGAGLLPFYFITTQICQPYGEIFNPAAMLSIMRRSAYYFAMAVTLLVVCAGTVGLLVWTRFLQSWKRMIHAHLTRIPGSVLWLAAAAIPLAVMVLSGWGQQLVRHGAKEWLTGVRFPYGLLLAAGVAALIGSRGHVKHKCALAILLVTAPLFFALKGLEPTGLWSQRRLLPFMLPLAAVLIAPLAEMVRRRIPPGGIVLRIAAGLFLLAAGSVNFIRWPAPYLVRNDQGSTAWVDAMTQKIGPAGLVVFDYFPFSVPFAVHNRLPVLGLGDYARGRWPEVMGWLSSTPGLAAGHVWVATTWKNPGLEEGVILQPMGGVTGRFPRVKSKTCLPAVETTGRMDVALLAMVPLPAESPALLATDKFLDGGPLALRGPWDLRLVKFKKDGEELPAQWSREGSGVIGPVPAPGQSVVIALEGGFSARDPRRAGQWLTLTPPWRTPTARLCVSNTCIRVKLRLTRPAQDAAPLPRTGVYTLNTDIPYDPVAEGIRGYNHDLGILVHRIRISENPAAGSAP